MTEQKCPHQVEITEECKKCESEPDPSNILALVYQCNYLISRLGVERKRLENARIENHSAAMLVLAEEHVAIRKTIGLAGDCDVDDVIEHFENIIKERDELKTKLEDLELCYRGCSVISSDLELEIVKLTTELQKTREQIDKLTPKWIKPSERLPDADCQLSVIKNGSRRTLTWNSYHQVWDDDEGDDFYCEPLDVDYWLDEPFVDDPVAAEGK